MAAHWQGNLIVRDLLAIQRGKGAFMTHKDFTPQRAHLPLSYQEHEPVSPFLGGLELNCNHS